MAGTFSKIYIHVVFGVKSRARVLRKPWREEVFKYIAGIIEGKGCKAIIVNGVEDHVHCCIGIKPVVCISDLVRDVKNNSSRFINDRSFVSGRFEWQEGYGVFSVSHIGLDALYQYILNQEEHHKRRGFREEYIAFLKEYEVEFQERFFIGLERRSISNFTPSGLECCLAYLIIRRMTPLRGLCQMLRCLRLL